MMDQADRSVEESDVDEELPAKAAEDSKDDEPTGEDEDEDLDEDEDEDDEEDEDEDEVETTGELRLSSAWQ